MKKLSMLFVMGLSAVVLAACGGGQSAQSDDQNNQPETVIVYRDGNGDDSNNSSNSNDSGNSNSNTQSSSQSASFDDDADDNMRNTNQLPQGFPVPVPDDYQVQRVGETEREIAVDLQVPNSQDAYDYYTQALQDEGFQIEETDIDNDSFGFEADIDFRNDQYDGNMDFSGEIVEIDLEMLGSASGPSSSGSSEGSNTPDSQASTSSSQLPQGFPVTVPNDYQVQNVRQGGDDGNDTGDTEVFLTVPDGRQAFDYFNQNLASDGFTIEDAEIDNDPGPFDAGIDFNNAEYEGGVDINGNSVEIDLDNRNSGFDD